MVCEEGWDLAILLLYTGENSVPLTFIKEAHRAEISYIPERGRVHTVRDESQNNYQDITDTMLGVRLSVSRPALCHEFRVWDFHLALFNSLVC